MRFVLFLVLISSCQTSLLKIPPNSRSPDYLDSLKKYSNVNKKYVEFENQIFAKATIYSDDFREHLTKELRNLYGDKMPDGALELVRTKRCNVFLSITTPIYEEANINHKDNAIEVTAIQDGKTHNYDTIDKLIEESAVFREFFPYINNWGMNYLLEFKDLNCNSPMEIQVASPKTKLEIPLNF